METIIGFGIDVAPVPGLKTAFDILHFIWENVEKASNNRQALKNLAVSTGDILTAVNHLLSHGKIDEHIQQLLSTLEKVLDEIRNFAEEHVHMNMFKILIRNIDIEGKIERFQSRLQSLSMAFNIAAYGAIESQLERIRQGQLAASQPLLPPPSPRQSAQVFKVSPPRLKVPNTPNVQPQRNIHVGDYEPVRAGASFTKPCKMEIRNGVPVLTSLYEDISGFTSWGLNTTKSIVLERSDCFDIVHPRDSRTWSWTIISKIISVSLRNPAFPGWKNSMDIVFPSGASAIAWFSWLQSYAVIGSADLTQSLPRNYEVKVRRKYHCWMRKTPTHVERQPPDAKEWTVTVSGHPQNFKAYTTHFTYVNGGRQPFTTVYRSGDTIVQERFVRADNEEPTTARRFRFNTEEQAKGWYTVWRDCARDQDGFKEPLQVEVTTKCPHTIQLIEDVPVLTSKLWSEVPLLEWRPPRFMSIRKRTETVARTTAFTWLLEGKKVTVYAALASQPDWFDVLEIVFRNSKSSGAWFSYLTDKSTNASAASNAPRSEDVAVTNTRVCWIHINNRSIETRRATSGEWHAIFGKYRNMEDHGSHLSIAGKLVLPHLRIARTNDTLVWEHRASANEVEAPVSRHYRFESEVDAKKWYEIWKEYLKKVTFTEGNRDT